LQSRLLGAWPKVEVAHRLVPGPIEREGPSKHYDIRTVLEDSQVEGRKTRPVGKRAPEWDLIWIGRRGVGRGTYGTGDEPLLRDEDGHPSAARVRDEWGRSALSPTDPLEGM